jgi:hypothetical protein
VLAGIRGSRLSPAFGRFGRDDSFIPLKRHRSLSARLCGDPEGVVSKDEDGPLRRRRRGPRSFETRGFAALLRMRVWVLLGVYAAL